jgi:hypothetical protein
MQPELLEYIETLLKSDVGLVEHDPELNITTYPEFVAWLMANCYQGNTVVTFEKLNTHWESVRPEVIDKKRFFYLNELDFKSLNIPVLKGNKNEFLPYLQINNSIVVYDTFVKIGEIYWCTPDEFQILKAK